MMTPQKEAAVRANIFSAAHSAIASWNDFPWHRYRVEVDTDKPHSSQALCISLWGTIGADGAQAVREIMGTVVSDPRLRSALMAAPRVALEHVDRSMLAEHGGTPTNLDALVAWPGLLAVVESKLGEPLGKCGMVPKKCSGIYGTGSALATRTGKPCRLAVADGRRGARRYWDVMERISVGKAYRRGDTCAFAGREFQVMRNIAFAAEAGHRSSCDWRVVFAFSRTMHPDTDEHVETVVSRLLPEHSPRVLRLDYDELRDRLLASKDGLAADLGRHLSDKLEAAKHRSGLARAKRSQPLPIP
jgi:hypothetical protein